MGGEEDRVSEGSTLSLLFSAFDVNRGRRLFFSISRDSDSGWGASDSFRTSDWMVGERERCALSESW